MQLSSLIGHTQELFGIIVKSHLPADSLIDRFFRSHKYLGSHDRRFIAETTYELLRHLRKCEFILNSVLAGVEETLFEEDKHLLIIMVYLALQGKAKEITSDLVSAKLKSTRLKEQLPDLFPNLIKPVEVRADSDIQRIGIEYSFPDWIVQRFIDQYGESETEKICSSLNEPAPLTLRVNTLRTDVEQCQAELHKQGVETSRTRLSPFGITIAKRINAFSLKIFRDGWFEVQDEGSQLLPFLLDPKPNIKLLDVCAGGGGKTLEFAALMKNRGEIFATDINAFRLDELRKRAKRAGAQNVRVQEIQGIDDLSERFKEFFDIVFVDAPCSGIGTIRRNPGMKWMVIEQTVNEISKKQKAILHSSAPLVKLGGKLVYATCTLLRQENEDVMEEFLSQHPEFTIVKLNVDISTVKSPKLIKDDLFFSLFPHIHGTDGFFFAVMEKQMTR
jgi:16S rRNA (cytosine967-C5)-methyltransferase